MKRTVLTLTFTLIILSLTSCFLFKKQITFYVNDTVETTIPATLNIDLPFNIPIPPVSTSATQEFENKHTAPDLLQEVSLVNLTMTITNPANEDFSFLKDIYVYIQKSDGSDEQLIAYATDINSSSQSISLTCTGENLVPYLQDTSYKLRLKVKAKEILTHDVDITISLKFKITAGIAQ